MGTHPPEADQLLEPFTRTRVAYKSGTVYPDEDLTHTTVAYPSYPCQSSLTPLSCCTDQLLEEEQPVPVRKGFRQPPTGKHRHQRRK